jgi:hypothetical protein
MICFDELPVLIENVMEHVSWTVSHAQTEIQRPNIVKNFTKIKNYGQGYVDLALYRNLCRLLTITISWDRKTSRPIP